MARKLGAAILAVAGLGSMLLALASSASAIPKPRRPSIAWLSEMATGAPDLSVRAAIPEKAAVPAAPAPTPPSSAKAAQTVARPLPPQEPPKAQPAAAAPGQSDAPRPPLASAIASPRLEAAPAIPKPGAATAQGPAPTPAAASVPGAVAPIVGREPPKAKPEPVVAKAGAAGPELAKPAAVEPAPKPAEAMPAPKPADAVPAPKPPEAAPAAEEEGTGTLSIVSEPPGAEVFLDGASVGQTPIEIDVPAGLHKVRLAAPGGGPEKRQNVHVKAGRTAEVRVGF
jgi:hypothetical protein